jgi:phosphatidylglycerophosphatase A
MNLTKQLATMFGIGRLPYAPGTAASLVAALAAWPIAVAYGHWVLLGLGLAVSLLAIPIAAAYARECGRDDPSECVIDELAGQWIALAFVPPTLVSFALGFAFFRALDISKLWPVSQAEKLKGGLGIVADDVVAGSMAGLFVLILVDSGYL